MAKKRVHLYIMKGRQYVAKDKEKDPDRFHAHYETIPKTDTIL